MPCTTKQLRTIDRQISEAFGFEPGVTWDCVNADKTATMISFSSRHEANEWYAEKLRDYPGYFRGNYYISEVKHYPRFSTDPTASKQLRDKLAEKWNWMLGCGGKRDEKPFGFALFDKRQNYDDPAFIDEAETEYIAVAIVALKSVGIEVEL